MRHSWTLGWALLRIRVPPGTAGYAAFGVAKSTMQPYPYRIDRRANLIVISECLGPLITEIDDVYRFKRMIVPLMHHALSSLSAIRNFLIIQYTYGAFAFSTWPTWNL